MMASLLELAGLDWPVPDFSTLCRRQKTMTAHIPCRPSTSALHLLIDSPGVKAEGDGEWLAKKHRSSKPRDWRKVHPGFDAGTLEIRAVEIIGSRIGDAPVLPDLLDQIPADLPLGIVTADGANNTRACHAAIAAQGAAAAIPPRKNGKPWKEHTAGAAVRNDALRSCRRLGRAIWNRWTGYHRRSLAEAKMRCLKLLGERVMSRDFDRRVAALKIRAAILNRFTALGTPLTQRAGLLCPGKGELRASVDLGNKDV